MVSLSEYAQAVPINAMAAFGLGPSKVSNQSAATSLKTLRSSHEAAWLAIESIGTTGRMILSLLIAFGHRLTAEQFAFETQAADPSELAEVCVRLEQAGLIARGADGSIVSTTSMIDAQTDEDVSVPELSALNSDVLQKICQSLRIAVPKRKQERLDAIAAAFADRESCAVIRRDLSAAARELLDKIALLAGPVRIDAAVVGIPGYQVRYAVPSKYRRHLPPNLDPIVGVLSELTHRGIVGVSEWDSELWIWREARPVLERPMYRAWPEVRRPGTGTTVASSARIPSIVAASEQILRRWEVEPPPVLKNGERRIGKAQVRSTAKALKLAEVDVDLVGRLVIGIGLLLPNVVATSGRGRQRSVDHAWMADGALVDAWNALTPSARWARLVKQWCDPGDDVGPQLLFNRHLVLWELAQLAVGEGYDPEAAFCTWLAHRYGPIGHAVEARECIDDLRSLGIVEATGPLALTPIGRQVLDDPASVVARVDGDATQAFVQADLTVVAPPNLRHDIAVRLATLAEVENQSGAVVSRLTLDRITTAVQRGESVETIVEFLTELSSVPLADTVVRLVHDAASRVGRIRIVHAPTVVAVNDPADLVAALAVKAAKLTRVTDTVAVSELSHAKVRAALDKQGLAPDVVGATVDRDGATRSSAGEARVVEEQAQRYREMAERASNPTFYRRQADALASRAAELTNYERRLSVTGPLALTPSQLRDLDAPRATGAQHAATSTDSTS